jgi:hypothetical protein
VLRVRFPGPQTEPQNDLPKAHLLEKEEVQEEALLSFPRRVRLPTTKSISREPLCQHLSSTVPIQYLCAPSQPRVGLLFPVTTSTSSSTACHFSARPIAEPIPRSPSSIIHARLRSRPDLRRLVRLTGCHPPSPRLTHAFLQEPLHLASPIDESIADCCCYCLLQLLGHPCLFLRQPAPEVLSSFGTSSRHKH